MGLTPYARLQWQGTKACIALHCVCGVHGHIDDEFMFYAKCGECGQVYEMIPNIKMEPIDRVPEGRCQPIVFNVPRTYEFEDP